MCPITVAPDFIPSAVLLMSDVNHFRGKCFFVAANKIVHDSKLPWCKLLIIKAYTFFDHYFLASIIEYLLWNYTH